MVGSRQFSLTKCVVLCCFMQGHCLQDKTISSPAKSNLQGRLEELEATVHLTMEGLDSHLRANAAIMAEASSSYEEETPEIYNKYEELCCHDKWYDWTCHPCDEMGGNNFTGTRKRKCCVTGKECFIWWDKAKGCASANLAQKTETCSKECMTTLDHILDMIPDKHPRPRMR